MPRKRMIHQQFFTSARLAKHSYRAMITFAGLWIYCDDFGRGEDDASFIAAAVWPRRADVGPVEVSLDLDALAHSGTLCRYEVGGATLLHIPSWFEHQKVSHPTPSKLPPCPTCDRSLYTEWYRDDDTATDRFRRAEKAARAARTGARGAREEFANRSGNARESLRNNSGRALPSLVQFSLVQFRGGCGQLGVVVHRDLWMDAA